MADNKSLRRKYSDLLQHVSEHSTRSLHVLPHELQVVMAASIIVNNVTSPKDGGEFPTTDLSVDL